MPTAIIPPNPSPLIARTVISEPSVVVYAVPMWVKMVSSWQKRTTGRRPYTLERGMRMSGERPPVMMDVVVLYVTIGTGTLKAALSRLRLGFGTAALNGPSSAMTLT